MSSDYTPPHHSPALASQPSVASALSQAPRFSPPKSKSRTGSPVRQPLQDRSNAQSIQYSGPTIRIVDDPGTDVYSKFPIPSEPSHILPPPRHAPGYGFERPGSRVSSGSQVASAIAKIEASRIAPLPHALQRKKAFRHSVSTSTSEADTLVASSFAPSSIRFSQGSTPPSSPPPELNPLEKGLDILEEESRPPLRRPTIRAVPPSSSAGESTHDNRAVTPKSDTSVASSLFVASSPPLPGDVGNPPSIDRPLSENQQVFKPSESKEGRAARFSDTYHRQPVLKPSTESFAYSDISSTSIEPTHAYPPSQPSPSLHEAHTATFASGARLNFPIVRAPSSTSLRAETQPAFNLASRMNDRSLVHQWSSALSTIPSLSERDSQSFARKSRSFSPRSRSQSQSEESYTAGAYRAPPPRKRGQTIASTSSSSDNVSSQSTEFSAVPLPLFSPPLRRDSDGESHHGEHLDTISPLPTQIPLRMKNSGYLQRQKSDAGSVDSRPGSSQSDLATFIHNNIPAWARVYYQRGERISMGAPESESSGSIRLGTSHSGRTRTPSESNFPLSIYRPRNRPRNHPDGGPTSFDDIHPAERDLYVLGPDNRPVSRFSTPHLRTDRRGVPRYSIWKAPSLDDDMHTSLFSRQNRQILLFCLGFIMPLAWMIASFLPLPPDPSIEEALRHHVMEERYSRYLGPTEDKSFAKANWWRNLNRIMSGIGTLLIGLIVALAILASRM